MNLNEIHIQFKCLLCGSSQYIFSKYILHLNLFHSSDRNFMIKCHITECDNIFNNIFSYKKHNNRILITKPMNTSIFRKYNLISEIDENTLVKNTDNSVIFQNNSQVGNR